MFITHFDTENFVKAKKLKQHSWSVKKKETPLSAIFVLRELPRNVSLALSGGMTVLST
jgi:hypothetical protein